MKKLFFLFIGLLSLFIPSSLNAQSLPEVDKLVETAVTVFKNEGEECGVQYFEWALQKALTENERVIYLELIAELGYAHIDYTGDNMKTVHAFERAYSLPFEPESKAEFEQLAGILTYLGYTYSETIGDFHSAVKPYKKVVHIFENELNEISIYRALNVEKHLGDIYTRQGDYAAAEVHLKFALNLLADSLEFDEAGIVASDLGLLYQSWGKTFIAEGVFKRGLSFPHKLSRTKIHLLVNYAGLLLELNEKEEALKVLDETDDLLSLNSKDAALEYWWLEYKGATLEKRALLELEKGNYEKAKKEINSSIQTYISLYGTDKRREIAKLYNVTAGILMELQDYEAAILANQQALSCVLNQYHPKRLDKLPDASIFFAENTIIEALQGMVNTYTTWFQENPKIEYLQQALEIHELIYYAEEELRRAYLYENSKLFVLEESQGRSEAAIILSHQLFEITDDPGYLYQAFAFAERNRSSLLREAMRGTKALEELGLTGEELEREKELDYLVSKAREERFYLQGKEVSDSLIQVADQALLFAMNTREDWIKSLENKHPRYYQLKYDDELPTLEEYQAMLSTEQLLIEYFIGKEHLYVFTINQKGLAIQFLPLPENLTQRVVRWRKSIEDYQYVGADRSALMAQYLQGGDQLYQDVLKDVLAKHPRTENLLIIPSGILDLLPFEALLQQPSNSVVKLNDLPYLIQDYTIGYCYSASLFHALGQLERQGEGMGGFAPDFARSEHWAELSCSADLLENIDDGWQKELFLGRLATIGNFRISADKYQILHLSTHAQANAEFGDFSFIVFHNQERGYDSLFVKDIYLHKIETELVILSACETALGTLYNSEGVISLARAFHYAGARSVLTTLWSINESANCTIMTTFYEELADNNNKARALHNAKIKYLSKADHRAAHPVYWAGFQFSGNQRPLEGPKKQWWYYLGGFLLLALFGFGSIKWYRKRANSFVGKLAIS